MSQGYLRQSVVGFLPFRCGDIPVRLIVTLLQATALRHVPEQFSLISCLFTDCSSQVATPVFFCDNFNKTQ